MNRFKIAAASLGVAASTLAVLGITETAQASTTADGCTVRPYAPLAGDGTGSHGRTMVDYQVTVSCVAGVEIEIDQDFWEQDLLIREGNEDDEYTGTRTKWLSFPSAGTVTYKTSREIPSTGPIENEVEEVYQDVQFQVSVVLEDDIVLGGWTAEELTLPTPLHR